MWPGLFQCCHGSTQHGWPAHSITVATVVHDIHIHTMVMWWSCDSHVILVPAVHQYRTISSLTLGHCHQVNGIHDGTNIVFHTISTPTQYLILGYLAWVTTLQQQDDINVTHLSASEELATHTAVLVMSKVRHVNPWLWWIFFCVTTNSPNSCWLSLAAQYWVHTSCRKKRRRKWSQRNAGHGMLVHEHATQRELVWPVHSPQCLSTWQ